MNSKEKDGNCHWRKQGKTFDLGDKNDFENWSCGSQTTTTPAVTNTMTVTTTTKPKKTTTTKPTTTKPTTTKSTTNPSNTMPPLPPVKGESYGSNHVEFYF